MSRTGSAWGSGAAGGGSAAAVGASGSTIGSGMGGSIDARMRAVTGVSAAVVVRPAARAGAGVDAVGGFELLDPLGQLGGGRERVGSRLRRRVGEGGT